MNVVTRPTIPAFKAIKLRQQSMWASGDYSRIGVRLQIVGESLCEAVDLRAGENVIDVAAGNGNTSLAAARRLARVTCTDYVPELLSNGIRRAQADGFTLTTWVADAEDLPFSEGEFDVALSSFGVMFTPNQERAASEMLRIVRPGGRIGLANWTPDGFVGQLFGVVGRFVPPPADVPSPAAWGTETRLVELFGPFASHIRTERKQFVFRDLSADSWIETFRTYYGPIYKAFEALDAEGQQKLHSALRDLIVRFNRGDGKSLVLPADYLEIVITRA